MNAAASNDSRKHKQKMLQTNHCLGPRYHLILSLSFCSCRSLNAFAATLLLTTAASVHADTLVSSLGNFGTSQVYSPYLGFAQRGAWLASSFQTDTQSWTMTTARLELARGTPWSSTARVYLFSDDADRPGAPLVDLGIQTVTTNDSPCVFTPTNTVTLAPSTKYWIAVGNLTTNGGLNVGFFSDEPFAYSGTPGASMHYSASDGIGFEDDPPTTWNPSGSDVALLFAVDGTPVVVPSPTLIISFVDNEHAYITWPTNATGYSLQFATNSSSPAWTTFTNTPTVIGDRIAQIVDTTVGAKFYRLRKP